ncbi:hypothetical protein MY3957_005212 [Beauveria namnaoensis]
MAVSLFAAALACSTAYYWMPMKLASNQKNDPLAAIMQILVLMLHGCLGYGLLSASRAYPHMTDIVDYNILHRPAPSLMGLFIAGKIRGTRHDPPPPEVSGMGRTERLLRIFAPFALVYVACWLFCLASVGVLQIAPSRARANGDLTWGDLLRRPAVAGAVLFIVAASRLLGRVIADMSG